jgi:hypothetical protein
MLDQLLDHRVGAREERRRHGEAERPGGLQVDDDIEFGRLQHRQVGGLGALEDSTGVGADLTMHASGQAKSPSLSAGNPVYTASI